MHGDGVLLQFVGKGLFDVGEFLPEERELGADLVEDVCDVGGVGDGAVEVRGEQVHAAGEADFRDALEAIEVPGGVVSAQFDLQGLEAVALDPFEQRGGVAVGDGACAGVGIGERVEAADEVPGDEA